MGEDDWTDDYRMRVEWLEVEARQSSGEWKADHLLWPALREYMVRNFLDMARERGHEARLVHVRRDAEGNETREVVG